MNLIVSNTHHGRARTDVHGLYDYLFWDVELVHNHDLESELFRQDIWLQTSGFNNSYRYTADVNVSWLTKQFLAEFDTFKEQILEIAMANRDIFSACWYKDPDYYKDKTQMQSGIFKDTPGSIMPPHLDNSHILVQFIINLIDNCASTEMYEFNNTNTLYQSSKEKNKGIAFFNNPGAVHGIRNVTQDRYILYSALTLE